MDQTPPATPTTPTPPATEAKPADAPSLINEKADEPAGAPEKYEDFKVPDGFTLDAATSTEASAIFKDLGLNQTQAQKLVDFYTAKTVEATEAPFKLWAETQKSWQDAIKADADIGKRLPEVKATVSRAIDGLGDPALAAEFRKAMDVTGAGNHPAFVKAFYRLAQQVTEGKPVVGRGPSPAGQEAPGAKPRTAAAAMYPNLPT